MTLILKFISLTFLFFLFCHLSFSQTNSTTNLIAEYSFSGNTSDSSGHKLNGINHGATLTTDRFGREKSAYFLMV